MNSFRFLMSAACLLPSIALGAQTSSFFPKKDLGIFLAKQFDLASIRSSFGPRRTPQLRTFADFKMQPTKATDEVLEFDSEDWYYGLHIKRRGDFNKDGIEDLEVCFTDKARGGSYDTREGLLISRYSNTTYAVALSFSVDDCGKP